MPHQPGVNVPLRALLLVSNKTFEFWDVGQFKIQNYYIHPQLKAKQSS